MVFVELDFRGHVPIYEQIIDRVEHLIASDELKPGDQLPTVRELADELGVNFNTVARAYRVLDESGLISTQQGRGTYVLVQPPPERAESLRRETIEALTRAYLNETARMGFGPDEVSERLEALIADWRKQGVPPEQVDTEGFPDV